MSYYITRSRNPNPYDSYYWVGSYWSMNPKNKYLVKSLSHARSIVKMLNNSESKESKISIIDDISNLPEIEDGLGPLEVADWRINMLEEMMQKSLNEVAKK